MANTTETATFNVKSNIGEVGKDAQDAASDFQIMGLSLNGVKKGFASAAVTAKGMFGSVKAGLISTGIGAFVVIIGSLFMWFTKTKKGAEFLEIALAGVGAIMDVLTDVFALGGQAMVKAFEDPKKAVEELWDTMKDLLVNRMEGFVNVFSSQMKLVEAALNLDWDMAKEGAKEYGTALIQMSTGLDAEQQKELANGIKDFIDETVKATNATTALTERLQRLRDAQRKLKVDTAQSIAEVEKLKLVAEDITKTYVEREEAATKAFAIEKNIEDKRIRLAKEAVKIQKAQNALRVDVMAEDLDALAELEVNLANIQQESAGRQISLQNFLNGLRQTEADEKAASILKEKEAADKAFDDALLAAQTAADAEAAIEQAKADKIIAIEKAMEHSKKQVRNAGLKNISSGIKLAQSLAGENKKVQAGLLIAESIGVTASWRSSLRISPS